MSLSAISGGSAIRVPQPAITVDVTTVLQTMDGFGASDRDEAVALTDALADLFFSTTAGIGLSLLRVSMYWDGTNFSTFWSNCTKAAARGAKIWMAPWTAPPTSKSNSDENNGGHLLVGSYGSWATTIAGFQASLQSNCPGVNLYAVSVQNEPDFTASYNSMLYTNAEMAAFIDVLGPKLAALTPVPKLMTPETSNWANVAGFTTAIAGDSTAQSYLGIVAAHQYDGVSAPSTTFRPIWQTEMSDFNPFDASITHGLAVAGWIHDAIVTGGVSAWHYWMLNATGTDNEGLVGKSSDYTITKRLYVLGQWSKFVRPGFVRVGTLGTVSGVSLTAFLNPGTGASVIVAINTNGTPTACTIGSNAPGLTSVTPWTTSASLNLAAQSPVTLTGSVIALTLPASSVTSLVSA